MSIEPSIRKLDGPVTGPGHHSFASVNGRNVKIHIIPTSSVMIEIEGMGYLYSQTDLIEDALRIHDKTGVA